MALDQVWNDIRQASFESYLEVRPVTLEELRTRIAAEVAAAAGVQHGNPFWWDSWETDNHFHFEGPPLPRASTPMTSTPPQHLALLLGSSASRSISSSLLSSSPSLGVSTPTYVLTRENLEQHERRLSRSKSHPTSTPTRQFSPAFTSTPNRPGTAGMRGLSMSCLRRQMYCSLVSTRELGAEDDVVAMPLAQLLWDDAPEQVDMEWETRRGVPDPPPNLIEDEAAECNKESRRSRQGIIALRMMPEATEVAINAKWNYQTEYAYGFARRDARAHTVEGASQLRCLRGVMPAQTWSLSPDRICRAWWSTTGACRRRRHARI